MCYLQFKKRAPVSQGSLFDVLINACRDVIVSELSPAQKSKISTWQTIGVGRIMTGYVAGFRRVIMPVSRKYSRPDRTCFAATWCTCCGKLALHQIRLPIKTGEQSTRCSRVNRQITLYARNIGCIGYTG